MLRPPFKRLDKKEVEKIARNFLGDEFLGIHVMDLWEQEKAHVFIKTTTDFVYSERNILRNIRCPIEKYLDDHGYKPSPVEAAKGYKVEVIK